MKRPLILLAILTLLLTSSCNHKELDFSAMLELTVNYDWSECPEANPKSMRLMVFREGTQPEPFPSQGSDGVTITLPANTYSFIGYNSDTEVLTAYGYTWESFEIASMTTSLEKSSRMFDNTRAIPMARGTEEESVIFEPDPVWSSAVSDIDIAHDSRRYYYLTMMADTHVYSFVINNVDNLESITEIVATVSGVSGSCIPSLGQPSDTHCVVPFKMKPSSGNSIAGTVRLFGHCPHQDNAFEHHLVVYLQMEDGSRWYYTMDITDAMHDENHSIDGTGKTEIPIVVPELPVPEPISDGSGLQPSVEDWQEIKVNVPL